MQSKQIELKNDVVEPETLDIEPKQWKRCCIRLFGFPRRHAITYPLHVWRDSLSA